MSATVDIGAAAQRWMTEHTAAWTERDPSRAEALFAENCEYVWHPLRPSRRGRAEVARYVQWAFDSQSDVRIAFAVPTLGNDRAAVEYWMEFVHIEEGRQYTIAGAQIIEFDDDGLATKVHDYWHLAKGATEVPTWWFSPA